MNRWGLYSLAALVLLVDQTTKAWVTHAHQFWPEDVREVIPGVFRLTYLFNRGGAFSILQTATPWLAAAALIAAVAIVVFTIRAKMPLPRLFAIALALPLGGALGNLSDRVRLGYVIDFLDVHAGTHEWPVFNIADSAICIGVVLLALYYSRQPENAPQTVSEKL